MATERSLPSCSEQVDLVLQKQLAGLESLENLLLATSRRSTLGDVRVSELHQGVVA